MKAMKVVVDGSSVRVNKLVERSGVGYGRESRELVAVVRRSTDCGGYDNCAEMPELERRSVAAEAAAVWEMPPLWAKVRLCCIARCLATSAKPWRQSRKTGPTVTSDHSY